MSLVCCRVGYDELPSAQLNIDGAGTDAGARAGTDSSAAGDGSTSGGSASGSTIGGSASAGSAGSTATPGGASPEIIAGETGSAGSPEPVAGSGGTGGSGGSSAGSGNGGSAGSGGAAGCSNATYGGHNYLVCTSPQTFVNAAVTCATQGYRPVRIDSAGEQTFVHDQIPIADQNNNNTSLWRWLGGDDQTLVGNWQWSDGTQFWSGGKGGTAINGAYTNWNINQPLSNQFCLAMEARVGAWYAMDCSTAKPYVCEQY